MGTSSVRAEECSFWKLINSIKVVVPNYQRDYAQGRNIGSAPLIRRELIKELVNSLCDNIPKELNFVFGGEQKYRKDDSSEIDVFVLVDGQQRLTTLFLFHWYVFCRAGILYDKLSEFSYETRKTSKRFCDHLLSLKKEDVCFVDSSTQESNTLSMSIKNYAWFSESFSSDRTIQSMLSMLDEIDHQFSLKCNSIDFLELATRIKGEVYNPEKENSTLTVFCPITFLCLNMKDVLGDGENSILDLYIKMNSRGKQLTDFEIFKAQLQKKQPASSTKFDLLKEYFDSIGEVDNADNRVKLISTFNTEYANVFFSIVDDGKIIDLSLEKDGTTTTKQYYDEAIMNFINDAIRLKYFTKAYKGKKKNVRNADLKSFSKISGKELISFVEDYGNSLDYGLLDENEAAESFLLAFKYIVRNCGLIKEISERGWSACSHSISKVYINEKECLRSLKDQDLASSVIRYGLFSFWEKFFNSSTIRDKDCIEAYGEWNRIIHNLTSEAKPENYLYRNVELTLQEIIVIDEIVESIANKNTKVTREVILDVISNFSPTMSSRFDNQLKEEIIKAKILLDVNYNHQLIYDAENKLPDGRIWPLLQIAFKGGAIFDEPIFQKALNLFSILFDGELHLNSGIDALNFEKALLCQKDNTTSKTAHLFPGDIYVFLNKYHNKEMKEYSEILSIRADKDRQRIILLLLGQLLDCKTTSEINDKLENIINSNKGALLGWKKTFVDAGRLDCEVPGFTFSKGIGPDIKFPDAPSDVYTLLYNTNERRTNSAEINSFFLAYELKGKGNIEYCSAYFSDPYFDQDGFPLRHLVFESRRIGYYSGKAGLGFYYDDGSFIANTIDGVKKVILKN